MDIEALKERVISEIDKNADRIIKIGEDIRENPEMGYKENKTALYVKDEFLKLGLGVEDGLALTGIKGTMKCRDSIANVAVIGELDAVLCSGHPKADKETGAAHACGHNAQLASMLGAAIGLSAVKELLDGTVTFFAVPAEEYVEIGYREKIKDEGKIEFFGGKQELIRIGAFDGIDMAMMVHAEGATPEPSVFVDGGSLGFVAKTVDFIGKASHAGGAPDKGINALNAAMAAMMCIHAQRETFRDEDKIRVHPIITKGGELVNTVPDNVVMETYVRGANLEAIKDAEAKVDRAIKGASYAIGAEAQIKNFKGYLPLLQNKDMSKMFASNASRFIPEDKIYHGIDMVGSTDMGDLGHIMPMIQPTMGGFFGTLHSAEFEIADKNTAYILPAKIMALTVIDLLFNGAEGALSVKNNFVPKMTKEEYIKF